MQQGDGSNTRISFPSYLNKVDEFTNKFMEDTSTKPVWRLSPLNNIRKSVVGLLLSPDLLSGKRLHSFGKSPFLVDKSTQSTISIGNVQYPTGKSPCDFFGTFRPILQDKEPGILPPVYQRCARESHASSRGMFMFVVINSDL